jgi:hypothetical protein
MSDPIQLLVDRLKAKKSGSGWMAKCPAHEDQNPSLSISEDADGGALLKCFAGCSTESVLAALGLTIRDLFPATHRQPSGKNSMTPRSPRLKVKQTNDQIFDWRACVDAFTDAAALSLRVWRGYSIALCRCLKQNGLIGMYQGCLAFPVQDTEGNVVAVHYRLKDGSWRYFPQGGKARLLVIGEVAPGDTVHIFESQWDAFSFMDVSGERSGILITRGASNGALASALIPKGATVYLWQQNDLPDLKTGRGAGEEWTKNVLEKAPRECTIKRPTMPEHDLNDWTRAGATANDLIGAIANAETLRQCEYAEGVPLMTLAEREIDPENNLLGNRYLCRGGIMFFVGPSGIGKSSVSAQEDICWGPRPAGFPHRATATKSFWSFAQLLVRVDDELLRRAAG